MDNQRGGEVKTAVVGAGCAGAFLARLLKSGGEPFMIYNKVEETVCGVKPCAWGMRAVRCEEFCREAGLNLKDYTLKYYGTVSIQGVRHRRGMVMVDKPKLLSGLLSGIDVVPEEFNDFPGFDRVVDATGIKEGGSFHRTYQIRARGNVGEPSVYIDPEDSHSLLWLFPLGDGTVHVGVMALLGHRQPDMAQINRLAGYYNLGISTVLCECSSRIWAGGIREPIVSDGVWRVGESGGFVDPVSGSGMASAFSTALSAFKNWGNPDAYAGEVRRRFAYMDSGARVLRAVVDGRMPGLVDAFNYLCHGDYRGIPMTPWGATLLALCSREFRGLLSGVSGKPQEAVAIDE